MVYDAVHFKKNKKINNRNKEVVFTLPGVYIKNNRTGKNQICIQIL